MKLRCLTVAFCALLAAGCGRQLTQGEIVAKRYEPAEDVMMFIPMAISCGKDCTTTMMIPYLVHYDESFVLTVKGKPPHEKEEITEDWYVDKAEYERAETKAVRAYDKSAMAKTREYVKLREG